MSGRYCEDCQHKVKTDFVRWYQEAHMGDEYYREVHWCARPFKRVVPEVPFISKERVVEDRLNLPCRVDRTNLKGCGPEGYYFEAK